MEEAKDILSTFLSNEAIPVLGMQLKIQKTSANPLFLEEGKLLISVSLFSLHFFLSFFFFFFSLFSFFKKKKKKKKRHLN